MTKYLRIIFIIGLLIFGLSVTHNFFEAEFIDSIAFNNIIRGEDITDGDKEYVVTMLLIETAGFLINLVLFAFYFVFTVRFINGKKTNALFYTVTVILLLDSLLRLLLPPLVKYIFYAKLNLLDSWFLAIYTAYWQKGFFKIIGCAIMLSAALVFKAKNPEPELIGRKQKANATAFVGIASFATGFVFDVLAAIMMAVSMIKRLDACGIFLNFFVMFGSLAVIGGFFAAFIKLLVSAFRGKNCFLWLKMLAITSTFLNILFSVPYLNRILCDLSIFGVFYPYMYYAFYAGSVFCLYGSVMILITASMLKGQRKSKTNNKEVSLCETI